MKIIKPSKIMMFDYRFDTEDDRKNIAKILNSKLDKENINTLHMLILIILNLN